MTIITKLNSIADFKQCAAENPATIQQWKEGRCWSFNRVLVARTDQHEAVIFSEALCFRIYAYVVKLFKIFGDPYAARLQVKEVQFLNPAVLIDKEVQKAREEDPKTREVDQKTIVIGDKTREAAQKTEEVAQKELSNHEPLNAELSRCLENFSEGNRQKILDLLPQASSLPNSAHSLKALTNVLTYADESWYHRVFITAHPSVVKSMVEQLLSWNQEDSETIQPLEKMATALLHLDSQHANVKAFVAGFPSHMPPLLSEQNYETRIKAIRWKPALSEEEQIGSNCYHFLCSAGFATFFEHLAEPERRALIKPLFAHAARYEMCATKKRESILQIAQSYRWPSYQRDMLTGLAYTIDYPDLITLCLHPQADVALMVQILTLNPPDRRELCQSDEELTKYDDTPDPFFNLFLTAIMHSEHPDKLKLVLWLMEAVLEDSQRLKSFLSQSSEYALEVLAENFHRIPLEALNWHTISSSVLVKMATHLIEHKNPLTAANLKAIAHALAIHGFDFLSNFGTLTSHEELLHWFCTQVIQHPALEANLCQAFLQQLILYASAYVVRTFSQMPPAFQELFSLDQLLRLVDQKGMEEQAHEDLLKALAKVFCKSAKSLKYDYRIFEENAPLWKLFPYLGAQAQAHVILLILKHYSIDFEGLLKRVKNACPEAWYLVGQNYILTQKVYGELEAYCIAKTQNLISIVALLNGMAEQLKTNATIDYTTHKDFGALLTWIFKEGIEISLNSAPDLLLSETFFDVFLLNESNLVSEEPLLPKFVRTLRQNKNLDHKRLLLCLANRVLDETTYCDSRKNHMIAVRFVSALNAEQMQLIPWHSYSDKVMPNIIASLDAQTLQLLPLDIMWKYMKSVVNTATRVALLKGLNDSDALKALDFWLESLKRDDLCNHASIELFPFGRLIDLSDDPMQIDALTRLLNSGYPFKDEALNQIAKAIENNPWKFWVVQPNSSSLVQESLWLNEPRKTANPQCAALAKWHEKRQRVNSRELCQLVEKIYQHNEKKDWKEVLQLLEMPQSLENEIKQKIQNMQGTPDENHVTLTFLFNELLAKPAFGSVEHLIVEWRNPSWDFISQETVPKVYEELRQFKRMLLANQLETIRGPSPRTLAKCWTNKQLSFTNLFCAIFDLQARDQLRQAAQLIADAQVYQPFLVEMQAAIGSGGKACFLAPQYNQPALSDVTLKIGDQTIHAHRAMLSLDPQLASLLSSQDKIIIVPDLQCVKVKSRLQRLYGTYTISEIFSEEGEEALRTAFIQKQTLAPLLATGEYSDITLEVEGKEFKAHKFILASALGYFAARFSSKMTDSDEVHIKLTDYSPDEIAAVLDYIYTNEKPNFADEESEAAFNETLNSFSPV